MRPQFERHCRVALQILHHHPAVVLARRAARAHEQQRQQRPFAVERGRCGLTELLGQRVSRHARAQRHADLRGEMCDLGAKV